MVGFILNINRYESGGKVFIWDEGDIEVQVRSTVPSFKLCPHFLFFIKFVKKFTNWVEFVFEIMEVLG